MVSSILISAIFLWRFEVRQQSSVDINTILTTHNEYRYPVGLGDIVWDASLALTADSWAKELAQNRGTLIHSRAGENLWQGTAGRYTQADMVHSWGREKEFFRYGVLPYVVSDGSANWEKVGHYTQILKATRVGCGIASNGAFDFLVCHYDKPNMLGEPPY